MRIRSYRRIAALVVGLIAVIGALAFAALGFVGNKTAAAFLPAPYTLTDPIAIHAKKTGDTITYSGEFPLQTQCGTISTGIATPESQTPRITLLFTVLEPAGGCPVAGSAMQPFSASYISTGGHDEPVFEGVTINGVIARYTLVDEK